MIKMKNKRTKQMISLALCLAMSQPYLPATVFAGKLSGGVETENATVSETDLPDNDELFAMYGANRGDSLTSVEQEIYFALKAEILKVAQDGGSTEFQLNVKDKGITLTTFVGGDGTIVSQFDVNFDKIYWMLIEDCPYELYWHDQNGNWNTGESGFSYAATDDISNLEAGTPVAVENMSFKFYVYTEYQKESNSYEVSCEMLETAKKAKANADAVIEQAKNLKSDYQKLLYCFNYIKEAVDYHESGYNDRISLQMTWVFDENPDTKVMSEGYAKAFKYLCDGLGVECYVVSGCLDWGEKSYVHTWNIVVLNENSYLVDVANCDANDGTVHSVGYPDKLFLKAPVSGTGVWNDPYIFSQADNVGYFYHDFSYAVFNGSEILTLADTDYTEPEIYKVVLSEEEFVYNGEEQKPTVTITEIEGEKVLVEKIDYTITYSEDMKKAGQKTITIIGKGDYEDIAITKTVTIKEKPLTVTGVTATNRTYDGTDKVAIESVTLGGIEGEDKVSVDCTQLEGTVSGVNAETYTSVTLPELTLTGIDAENYTLQPVKEFATTVTIEQAEVIFLQKTKRSKKIEFYYECHKY